MDIEKERERDIYIVQIPTVFIDIYCTYPLQPIAARFGGRILCAAPSVFPPKVKLPVTRSAGALGVWSAGGRTTSCNSEGGS